MYIYVYDVYILGHMASVYETYINTCRCIYEHIRKHVYIFLYVHHYEDIASVYQTYIYTCRCIYEYISKHVYIFLHYITTRILRVYIRCVHIYM